MRAHVRSLIFFMQQVDSPTRQNSWPHLSLRVNTPYENHLPLERIGNFANLALDAGYYHLDVCLAYSLG